MDKKTKKRIDVLQQKITKLQRLLTAEKEQPDDPAEIPRIEAELAKAHAEMSSLKSDWLYILFFASFIAYEHPQTTRPII